MTLKIISDKSGTASFLKAQEGQRIYIITWLATQLGYLLV